MTEQEPKKKRQERDPALHVVTEEGKPNRYVMAKSSASAIAYAIEGRISARRLNPSELQQLLVGGGIEVENAQEDGD